MPDKAKTARGCEEVGPKRLATEEFWLSMEDRRKRQGKVFIVRTGAMPPSVALENFLTGLGIESVFSDVFMKDGLFSHEKFERAIEGCSFGIALASSGDEEDESPEADRWHLELGLLLGALGAGRVLVLGQEASLLPNAFKGVPHLSFKQSPLESSVELRGTLENAGFWLTSCTSG